MTTRVVVLAPMPLELDAIVTAFGLEQRGDVWAGSAGTAEVTAVHIGMGPAVTRVAATRLLDQGGVDHMMIAGICGGLDPERPVGTLLNPEVLVDHATGATYRHRPPGDVPTFGRLVTTETVTFDHDLSRRLFAEGCLGVDMESSAVAEVCERRGCPWSVYRCIGDRYVDGILDERIVAMTNPDGTGQIDEIMRLIAAEPELADKLGQLAHDSSLAARLAAEAAVRGCLAL